MNHDAALDAEHRGKRRVLVRSASALVSTSAVTAGLGFVYWVVAARLFSPADLGRSATAIAAMSLIAPFAMLGFGTLFIAELPGTRQRRATLVATAAVVSGVAGTVIALVAALTLPTSVLGLPGIGREFPITALFVAGVAAQGVGLLLDQALLSVVGGKLQLLRNAVASVSKLVFLVVLALAVIRSGSVAIFASWFAANVISVAVLGVLLIRRFGVGARYLVPALSSLRGLRFDAAKHHALNMALFVPFFAMPIVANIVLGSEQAGYLFATWSIAGFMFHLPVALAMALFTSGARDTGTFLMEFRFTLRRALLVCVAANAAIAVLGPAILRIFGRNYATNGQTALMVICLGGLGLVIKDHHVALARITGRVGREGALITVLGAGELLGAAIGAARGGVTGLSIGWLAAVAVEVLVCAPMVWRAYRGRIQVPTRTAAATAAGGGP
jgi:O-antigen/teichoic acid export membrane protein